MISTEIETHMNTRGEIEKRTRRCNLEYTAFRMSVLSIYMSSLSSILKSEKVIIAIGITFKFSLGKVSEIVFIFQLVPYNGDEHKKAAMQFR